MKLIFLLGFLVLVSVSTGGYIWYLKSSAESLKNVSIVSSPEKSPFQNTTLEQNTKSDDECGQFSDKFGVTLKELVQELNNEPDVASVVKGYRQIYGKITGILPGSYLPVFLKSDSSGRIIDFVCQSPTEPRDYSQDFDFTIIESDLAQIIRYRETLEENQAPIYLQNVTTMPTEVKQKLLERIEALSG